MTPRTTRASVEPQAGFTDIESLENSTIWRVNLKNKWHEGRKKGMKERVEPTPPSPPPRQREIGNHNTEMLTLSHKPLSHKEWLWWVDQMPFDSESVPVPVPAWFKALKCFSSSPCGVQRAATLECWADLSPARLTLEGKWRLVDSSLHSLFLPLSSVRHSEWMAWNQRKLNSVRIEGRRRNHR